MKPQYILLGIFLLCIAILSLLPHSRPASEPTTTPTCADTRARVQAAIRDGDSPGFLDREALRICREIGE